MNQRVSIIVIVMLSFSAFLGTREALGSQPWSGRPHTVTLKLEPSYVTPGSTAEVIATFTPCVDIESLEVRLWLPPEVVGEGSPPLIRERRGRAKKGQEIVVSGLGVFPKPGVYVVQVSYRHLDPQWSKASRADVKNFPIRVPGGIVTARRVEDELPYRVKETPEGMTDTVREGQLLHFPVKAKNEFSERLYG